MLENNNDSPQSKSFECVSCENANGLGWNFERNLRVIVFLVKTPARTYGIILHSCLSCKSGCEPEYVMNLGEGVVIASMSLSERCYGVFLWN